MTGTLASVTTTTVPKLRKAIKRKSPGLHFERELWEQGLEVVVGVDEVGRGSWAGPISVGAAVVPKDRRIYKVRDSKMLREEEREALFGRIAGWVEAWAVGHASHWECDRYGMSEAQKIAARRAIAGLGVEPDIAIIDGNWDFLGSAVSGGRTKKIVKGDAVCLSVASASILAKVTRDRIMRRMAIRFPGYNFENNKGYNGPHHVAGLAAFGPSPIHRKSWAFMDTIPEITEPRYRRPDPQGQLFD
ncbi:MAG: ribonuclease HII [Acidimicrobiia bacterium]